MVLPDLVGRLRRVRKLGAGSFATVWLYHDDELDSDVAIKALADNWVDQLDVADRFVTEARVLRRADSEYVVQVHDIGEIDGTPYFVMSYADLGTVADLAQDGPLDLATTSELIGQAAIGLSDLHASGIVHRDVKPQNLLLRSDRRIHRRVQVTDLGMAKELAFASGMTQLGGSPGYMAPEQARVGARIDERADVYGLGAVAYRLLSGQLVRDVSIAGVADAEPPPPLSEIADVPQPVSDVIMHALEVEPDERWSDPVSFVAAYQDAAAGGQGHHAGATAGMTATPSHEKSTEKSTELAAPAEQATRRLSAATTDRVRAGRRRPWLIPASIMAAAAVTLGLILLLDPFGADRPGESGNPGSTPDASPEAGSYCQLLLRHEDDLAKLSSSDLDDVQAGVAAVHTLREAAPEDIADRWAGIDDPLVAFETALKQSDSSWDEYATDPEGADPEVIKAAADMQQSLAAVDDAVTKIEQHAQQECGSP